MNSVSTIHERLTGDAAGTKDGAEAYGKRISFDVRTSEFDATNVI